MQEHSTSLVSHDASASETNIETCSISCNGLYNTSETCSIFVFLTFIIMYVYVYSSFNSNTRGWLSLKNYMYMYII